jgi:CRP/FNR family transcriptional regulator
MSEILHVMGAPADEATAADLFNAPLRRVRRGQVLFHEGAPAEAIYVVRFGGFKTLRVAADGYEQVLAFSAPGDVIGFDALAAGKHPTMSVALEDSGVHALPLGGLDALRQRLRAFDHALQIAISRQLARTADVAELMAAVAAEVRLARFLVQLSARMAERGLSARRLRLTMSRRDIASYMGVAHETVSRSLGALIGMGCVEVHNRDIEILDPARLRECASCTRGASDEGSTHAPRLHVASAGVPAAE